MKKVILYVLFTLFILNACNKSNQFINDPEKAKQMLLGYWVYDFKINDNSVVPIVHYFSQNGNYTIANFLGATIQKNSWKIEKNHLIISYKDNNQASYELVIENITDFEMTVINKRDNEKQVWKKGSR